MTYDIEERRRNKMIGNDRVIVLRVKEGMKAMSAAGVVDTRLFTDENRLHAVYDDRTGMWNMKYETGGLPGALQQKFIEFNDLVEAARKYYGSRNIEIKEILN